MTEDAQATLIVRLLGAIGGFFTGAIYGSLLAFLIGIGFTQSFSPAIVEWTAGVFTLVGFFFGNVILETTLILLHFLWGLFNGLAENENYEPFVESSGYLKTVGIFGFSTGLALLCWYWHYRYS